MVLLHNKVALVTGGSRGIGASIVRRLSADGAAVAFTYMASSGSAERMVDEIEARGKKAMATEADSADIGQVRNAVRFTVEAYGGIDILVNNADVDCSGTIFEYSLEQL